MARISFEFSNPSFKISSITSEKLRCCFVSGHFGESTFNSSYFTTTGSLSGSIISFLFLLTGFTSYITGDLLSAFSFSCYARSAFIWSSAILCFKRINCFFSQRVNLSPITKPKTTKFAPISKYTSQSRALPN